MLNGEVFISVCILSNYIEKCSAYSKNCLIYKGLIDIFVMQMCQHEFCDSC